ncbi:hypothetical protein [Cellulophaga geojensis]|nr:hypothetical protein [Cellulophaga geojensis]
MLQRNELKSVFGGTVTDIVTECDREEILCDCEGKYAICLDSEHSCGIYCKSLGFN